MLCRILTQFQVLINMPYYQLIVVDLAFTMSKNKQSEKRAKEIYLERKQCDCVAQKHELINNCLNCGKVVCAQEGQGPCFCCGNIVSRPDSNYKLANDEALFPSLPQEELSKVSQERSKAILHRNKLVERDKQTTPGQNIFDEQVDYYEVTENQWIDEKDRQRAVERILEKNKNIEQEQTIHRVKFDPITGQFIREEFKFDEDGFKEEARKFTSEKENEQLRSKMEAAKMNKAWDSRLLANERMKGLISDLEIGKRTEIKQQLLKRAQERTVEPLILEEDLDQQNRVLPQDISANEQCQ